MTVARSHRHCRMLMGAALLSLPVILAQPLHAQTGKVIIVQTKSAGDSVSLIDPATDKIVAAISDAIEMHGIAAAPDATRLHLSNESPDTLDIGDVISVKNSQLIPLSPNVWTNSVATRHEGRCLDVAIQG